MLEHNEHDKTKKESTHLDLRVNGKLHRKKATSAVLTGIVQFYGVCPCSTRVYAIKTTSNANAPKRRIVVRAMLYSSSFGRMSIRATDLPLYTSQKYKQQQKFWDLVKNCRSWLHTKKNRGASPMGPWPI